MYRKNCFAYKEKDGQKYCTALLEMKCEGCKFFKTHAEYNSKVRPLQNKN